MDTSCKNIKLILCILLLLGGRNTFSQFKITSGATVTCTGNVQVYIVDLDLDNAGILDGTASTFHFTGTGNNSITGNGSFLFNNFTINKTAGGLLTLNSPININGNLNFLFGNIELNSRVINLNNTGLLIGESATSHVTGIGGGSVNANLILTVPSAANIGNLGAVITSTGNLGIVNIIRKHQSANIPVAFGKSIYRSFEITTATPSPNATLTINYFDTELNGINENNLTHFKSPDGITYTNMNFSSRDAVANYVTQNNYTGIAGIYTLSEYNAALPITLISFGAQCKDNFIQLSWKTATEQNSDRFDIQRSGNGTIWEKIAAVKSAGNSNNIVAYNYDDKTLNEATAFYRLAQYDLDGKVAYSSIVKAGCGKAAEFIVMPNPVVDIVRVVIGSAKNNTGTLILFNAAGQQVLQQSVTLTSGVNQYALNMGGLAKGTYNLLFIQTGAANQHLKIIKQ